MDAEGLKRVAIDDPDGAREIWRIRASLIDETYINVDQNTHFKHEDTVFVAKFDEE